MARRGPLTEEQRQELRARMEKGRATARLNRLKASSGPLDRSPPEEAAGDAEHLLAEPIGAQFVDDYAEGVADGVLDQPELADFEQRAIADGILTIKDILAIRVEAKQKVLLEQKAAAKKKLIDQMVERERRSAGLIPAETEHQKWLDEVVSYTVRLPKQGPRDVPEHRVDGRVFTNGRSYEVRRAEYQSLVATEQSAWHHQAQIMGQSRTYYDELLGTMVYQGGVAIGSGRSA